MDAYDLTRLDSNTFEQMVNMLAMRVLGAGATGFGPGADGGRDGWFQGEASYPSSRTRWSGTWYLQSKFHKPHLSKDSQKWLLSEIKDEVHSFQTSHDRRWPDIWIIASNIEPSGKPQTGSFDAARTLVSAAQPTLGGRFHIWGGAKILSLLAAHRDVAEYYAEFLTPGHVISSLYQHIVSQNASSADVVRDLCVTAFDDYQHTRLDQAGSDTDNRPGIHKLYTDLPFSCANTNSEGMVAVDLGRSSALRHNEPFALPTGEKWERWAQQPARSKIWFIKGGPGQGKSTSTQFIAQVQRAAIILSDSTLSVTPSQRELANEIKERAVLDDIWPLAPRLPVTIELRDFAQWLGARDANDSTRMLVYIVNKISKSIGHNVAIGTFKSSLSHGRWLFVFDGLDEVPGDVKDAVASEVRFFSENLVVGAKSDALIVCTSRPQGYSGQFETMTRTVVDLSKLNSDQALICATPVLKIGHSKGEYTKSIEILREALSSSAVREIMTTPLQSHIMAVVVRNGGKPPERKWQLFNNFYEVMKRREASRALVDSKFANVLVRGDKLIKSLHARLGFELHARAETSKGATTSLSKVEFKSVVETVVSQLQDNNVSDTVDIVMEATTDRLVLVNTPENGELVRFDIRPLQEFFAAQYIYDVGGNDDLRDRLFAIGRDSHWREVMHFYISALVENDRKSEVALAVQVLNQVNGAALGEESRPLSMRLALGAVQAGRLLSEGVLEQDKRIRATFRTALEPIAGCTDALDLMSDAMPTHSESWFTDVLLSSLREKAETECIGAVLLLCNLMKDGNVHISEVTKYILAMSSDAKRTIFSTLGERYEPWGRYAPANWIKVIAVKVLSESTWADLDGDYWRVTTVISSSGDWDNSVGALSGWSEELSTALPFIVGENRFPSQRSLRPTAHESLCGIALAQAFESELPSLISKWSEAAWQEFSTKGGMFRGAYLTLRYHHTSDTKDLGALLDWINAGARRLEALGHILSGFVDSGGRSGAAVADSIGPEVWRTTNAGCPRQLLINGSPEKADWAGALESHGDLLEHVIMYDVSEGNARTFPPFAKSRKGKAAIQKFIQRGFMDENLGYFMHYLRREGGLSVEVEAAILDRAKVSHPGVKVHYPPSRISINLPRDAVLLPYLLASFVSELLQQMTGRLGRRALNAKANGTTTINHYNLSYADLVATSADLEALPGTRLAAAILASMHSEAGTNSLEIISGVLGNPEAMPIWAKAGVMVALSDGVMNASSDHWRVASEVLDASRDQFIFRRTIDPLLKRWRERTASPVQGSLSTMHWHG
jgi:hypothetical protein